MITAPLPPAKMAPVMAKKRKMYSLCWNIMLKKKMNMHTPRIARRRTLICCSGVRGFVRNGMTTSWMNIAPQE